MSIGLFLRIARAMEVHCLFFTQRRNAAGQQGHSSLKKIYAVVWVLAYGCPADSIDWIGMANSTLMICLKNIVRSIIEIFEEEYLRAPNDEGIVDFLRWVNRKAFPSCLEALNPCIGCGTLVLHCMDNSKDKIAFFCKAFCSRGASSEFRNRWASMTWATILLMTYIMHG